MSLDANTCLSSTEFNLLYLLPINPWTFNKVNNIPPLFSSSSPYVWPCWFSDLSIFGSGFLSDLFLDLDLSMRMRSTDCDNDHRRDADALCRFLAIILGFGFIVRGIHIVWCISTSSKTHRWFKNTWLFRHLWFNRFRLVTFSLVIFSTCSWIIGMWALTWHIIRHMTICTLVNVYIL